MKYGYRPPLECPRDAYGRGLRPLGGVPLAATDQPIIIPPSSPTTLAAHREVHVVAASGTPAPGVDPVDPYVPGEPCTPLPDRSSSDVAAQGVHGPVPPGGPTPGGDPAGSGVFGPG